MDKAKVKKEIVGWVLTILAVLAFRSFLFEPVYIPSGSMIPTLEVGDYVVVHKWAYGLRIPFTASAQITWSTPKRGDIVVLLPPVGEPGSDDLIKRVVAVEGDKVAIRDGALIVNDQPVPHAVVPESVGKCRYWSKAQSDTSDERTWAEFPCVAYQEELNGHHYETYCSSESSCGRDLERLMVPKGTVFLAGDHRDDSRDSRWFGPQPVGRIKGRAWVALMSWGSTGPRWNRFFHRVDR